MKCILRSILYTLLLSYSVSLTLSSSGSSLKNSNSKQFIRSFVRKDGTDTKPSSKYSISSLKRLLSEDDMEEQDDSLKKKKHLDIEDSGDGDVESPLLKQKRRRQPLLDAKSDNNEMIQHQENSNPIETNEMTTMKPLLKTALRSQSEESNTGVTDKPDAPQLVLSVSRVFPHNVTTSVQVTIPSRVWCTVRSRSDSEPTIKMLKHYFARDVVNAITIDYDRLESATAYVFYCYGESLTGIPMVESVSSVSIVFSTPDEEGAGKLLLSKVHRTATRISFSFPEPLTNPTICRLLDGDGSIIRSQVIDMNHRKSQFSMDDLNPSTDYRFFCGSGPDANEMSRHFDITSKMYWLSSVPVSHTRRNLLFIGCGIVLVVVGFKMYPRVKPRLIGIGLSRDDMETEPDPAQQSLLPQKRLGYENLSKETEAVLDSLESRRWRCDVCQYLNTNEATECVICHSQKQIPGGDVYYAPQVTEPKAAPQIMRVTKDESASEDSDDDSVSPVPPVQPIQPSRVKSSEAAGVVIRQKATVKSSVPITKSAPVKIIPATKGLKLSAPVAAPRKPVVLKKASEVKTTDDLFAELGLNAQVKKTTRISSKKPVTLDMSSSDGDAWKEDDLDISYVC